MGRRGAFKAGANASAQVEPSPVMNRRPRKIAVIRVQLCTQWLRLSRLTQIVLDYSGA